MSLPLRVYAHQTPLSHPHRRRRLRHNQVSSDLNLSNLPLSFQFHTPKNPSLFHTHFRPCRRCSINNTNADAPGMSDADNFPADIKGSAEKDQSHQRVSLSSNETLKRLKRYGLSGILAYGLLNTAYYLTMFLLVWLWFLGYGISLSYALSLASVIAFQRGTDFEAKPRFYIAPAPGRMGYFAAVQRFLKLMAMVWAGSQVTKLLRAAGAIALAPFVDKALSWFTLKFKFESQGKAFLTIVGLCFGLALMLFLVVTLLWA